MTAVMLPEPTLANLDDDDGEVHLTCCDPDRALCGEELVGEYADGEPTDCIRCEVIDEAGVPCGVPLCRLRQWWRSR